MHFFDQIKVSRIPFYIRHCYLVMEGHLKISFTVPSGCCCLHDVDLLHLSKGIYLLGSWAHNLTFIQLSHTPQRLAETIIKIQGFKNLGRFACLFIQIVTHASILLSIFWTNNNKIYVEICRFYCFHSRIKKILKIKNSY